MKSLSLLKEQVASVETPDDNTVVITFTEADCSALFTALNIPQEHPARELQLALGVDHPSDVRRIALAAAVEHRLADLVELAADRVDVG